MLTAPTNTFRLCSTVMQLLPVTCAWWLLMTQMQTGWQLQSRSWQLMAAARAGLFLSQVRGAYCYCYMVQGLA